MDTPTLIGIGLAAGIGVLISNRLQKKKNDALAPTIEAALRAQGGLTLPALTEAVGLKGFMARGKVMLALNDMVARGKVRVIQAPEGTTQLEKVNFIKYELAA
ncbi:MAG TPA: hypothetical protein VIQ54_22555 [Polyangia bacterium]|jgi:hypothetical protein